MSVQYGLSVEQVLLTDVVVGLLCGRGGEKLTQLQAQSGCRIQLAQDRAGPEHRVCTLTGTPSAIALAKGALQGASQPPQQPSSQQLSQLQQQQAAYGAGQLTVSSINQYSQQAAYYRLLGMTREAEMLERQVAMWTQVMAQQQQQQLMVQQQQQAQQQQLAQYYRAMAGAGVGVGGGGEMAYVAAADQQRNEELED